MSPVHSHPAQRGVSLVIGMVILVMMTLVVLATVNMSTSNVKATANMQFRDAALAAANVALERVVGTNFVESLAPVTVDVDINQDGTTDYQIHVPKPECASWHIVLNRQLSLGLASDLPCFTGSGASGGGITGSGGANASLCADTVWRVRAPVVDVDTGASVTVDQGVSVRMDRTVAEMECD